MVLPILIYLLTFFTTPNALFCVSCIENLDANSTSTYLDCYTGEDLDSCGRKTVDKDDTCVIAWYESEGQLMIYRDYLTTVSTSSKVCLAMMGWEGVCTQHFCSTDDCNSNQPKPVTPQPKPVTPKPKPVTPKPKPVTPQPKPVTPQPKPVTPQPKPVTAPQPKPVTPKVSLIVGLTVGLSVIMLIVVAVLVNHYRTRQGFTPLCAPADVTDGQIELESTQGWNSLNLRGKF